MIISLRNDHNFLPFAAEYKFQLFILLTYRLLMCNRIEDGVVQARSGRALGQGRRLLHLLRCGHLCFDAAVPELLRHPVSSCITYFFIAPPG